MTWEALITLGLGVLRLPPESFWRMTLKELSVVLRGSVPIPPTLGREDLAGLMRQFPDH